MSHGHYIESQETTPDSPLKGALPPLARLLTGINGAVLVLSMVAILVACCILTGSVFLRYFLKIPTDWQDEASVFLLVGAIFLCGAYVQSQRGHVGIEALASILPESVNRLRAIFCDLVSLAFCALFSWKSWTLLHEAVVDGQTTSSSWAPPLWIPYGLMATGMTLLVLQILLQILTGVSAKGQAK